MCTFNIIFKVYFADDTVLRSDPAPDPRLHATFCSAPIIRFDNYQLGNSYGVYKLLTTIDKSVNVVSVGELIAAGLHSLQQP